MNGESLMKILALEFSSAQRSVAVLSSPEKGGDTPDALEPARPQAGPCPSGSVVEVIETGLGGTRGLALVADALREANLEAGQIECLAIGLGPGSYTGIRAAIALAQGWQLARGVKLIGIGSAECLAWQAWTGGLTGRVTVVIDAQRDEFYLSSCELGADGCREAGPLRLASLAEARECERAGEILIGPEATRWFPAGRILFPAAATLAKLAANRNSFVSGEKLEPIYLREANFVKAPPPRRLA